jgi:pyruvate dehydrogenase E1 component alpha subunit
MQFSDFDPLKGERLQVLTPDGEADPKLLPDFDEDMLRGIFRHMLAARLVDRHCVALQREGRLGTYPPLEGQEACQVGSVLALAESDWIVPSFRELAATLVRGVPLETILLYWMGNEEGSRIPRKYRLLPVAIPVGTHTLHAVGMAMALSYRGEAGAVVCYFGDGATSEGDFHEAMTMAGVRRAPVAFFCQNNAWAISVPRKIQCAAESLAVKAVGYGMPGIQVDGNDPFAVFLATRTALERGRAGGGPTFIEAVTYRLGPHTTSDDPSRYREDAEVEKMRALEPLVRYRRFLEKRGLWSQAREDELVRELEAWIEAAVGKAEAHPGPGPRDVFDHMFAELPPHLARQRAELLAHLDGEG